MAEQIKKPKLGDKVGGKKLEYVREDEDGNRLYEIYSADGNYSIDRVSGNREEVGTGFTDLNAAKDFIRQDMYPEA